VVEIDSHEPDDDPRDRDAHREPDAETLTSGMDVAELVDRPAHLAEPRTFTPTGSERSRRRT
jgi:hypothetical protein